jgi:hypothetical protein
MYPTLKSSIVTLVVVIFWVPLYSQNAMVSAGSDSVCNSGTINCTIGQTFQSIVITENNVVLEGIQQPYMIETLTGNEINIELDLVLAPNPTNGLLRLQTNGLETQEELMVQIFKTDGELIYKIKLQNNTTEIDLSNYPAATYILKVNKNTDFNNVTEIKTYKIIKY